MHLFYAPDIEEGRYTLAEEESKHCVRVLRLVEGDTLNITDGRGGMFTAKIVSANPKRCEVETVGVVRDFGKRPYSLIMAVAPTKNPERYDWFLEKATEIGVDRIIPVICDFSERRTVNSDRHRRVVTGAVKQSLKAYHPAVDGAVKFEDMCAENPDAEKFIAHCHTSADKRPLKEVLIPGRNTLIAIGPEGDFSEREVEMAKKAGFREVSLGDTRLRTETAAIVAVTAVFLIN